jgi:hypothetical protein
VERLEKIVERQRIEVDRNRNDRYGGRAVTAQVDLLREDLGAAQARVVELERKLALAQQEGPSENANTLYVLLDANGHPLSWPEISAHLEQLIVVGGFDPDTVQARVFNGRIESSADREDQWWNLLQHYRKLRGVKHGD